MRSNCMTELGIGALAGLVGTIFIRGGMVASQKWMPETLPPMKEDPGEFIVQKAESRLPAGMRVKIPERAESTAAQALAFGYGMTFAMLYAAMPRGPRNVVIDGSLLGTATWAAGYLGWIPAARLAPPIWRQSPKQVIPNLVSHAMFGIITVAVIEALEDRL